MNKPLRNELAVLCGLGALACLALNKKSSARWLGIAAGFLVLVPGKKVNLYGRSILITGGSRGLGFALAKQLVQEGAMVSLLARDSDELDRARNKLLEYPEARILTIPCDVTNAEELEAAIELTNKNFGSIDMLINNAGAIMVSPFECTTRLDYEAQLELHLYAPMKAVRLALPHLVNSDMGRIVNICSMGGKVAVPHMLPYDVSKFALAGFSQGITAELEAINIPVTTVYPALMRTGSPIQAVFKGDHEKEYRWFAASDVLPGLSMDADVAAKKIIAAAKVGQQELTLSFLGQLRMMTAAVFPELMSGIMAALNRLMPKGTSMVYKTGFESRKLFDETSMLQPLKLQSTYAEIDNNQVPKTDGPYNLGLRH